MLYDGLELFPSAYTLVVYEQEFGTDMLKDVFGGIPLDSESDGIELIASVGWNAALKALWALCRTADERTPSFAMWARKQTGMNLLEIFNEMLPLISDAFFRPSGGAEIEGEAEGEA